MTQLGMMVMLKSLGGNAETVNAVRRGLNQTIREVKLENDCLCFRFEDNYRLKLWDGGQSCCEHRYMRTDDELSEFAGAKLLNVRLEDAEPAPEDGEHGEEHEIQMLVIETDKGNFVMSNHNEHNGYYGGFHIQAAEG